MNFSESVKEDLAERKAENMGASALAFSFGLVAYHTLMKTGVLPLSALGGLIAYMVTTFLFYRRMYVIGPLSEYNYGKLTAEDIRRIHKEKEIFAPHLCELKRHFSKWVLGAPLCVVIVGLVALLTKWWVAEVIMFIIF